MSDATAGRAGERRRARVRTRVEAPKLVAAALRPDNTDEMKTRVADGAIETTIHRPSTGGLRTTLDDYVCNLSVATAVLRTASHRTDGEHRSEYDGHSTQHNHDGDEDTDEPASTDEHLRTDDTDTP